jgi:hypothetical protein
MRQDARCFPVTRTDPLEMRMETVVRIGYEVL